MSERRFDEGGRTEFERLLLGSARIDAPARSSKARALASAGVLVGATTASTAGGAVLTGVLGGMGKWVAVGVVTGAVSLGAIEVVTPRSSPPPRAVAATPQVAPVAARPTKVPPVPVEAPPPADSAHAVEPPASSAVRAAPAPAASPALVHVGAAAKAPPERLTLADEVQALDGVRRALAAGEADESLRRLDSFDRAFPHPALGPEVDLLRLQVLLAVGRVDDARSLGARLLAQQPDIAYRQRIQSLLGAQAVAP